MIKKLQLLILLMLAFGVNAQNSLAKIEYGYAEEAYAQKKYKKALEHIEEVKSLLGSTNARVMYLEIMARDELDPKKAREYFNAALKLFNLTQEYIKNFENDVPVSKLKKVYEIQKKIRPFTKDIDNTINGVESYESQKYEEAFGLLEKSCEAGNPSGCGYLSFVYAIRKDNDNLRRYLNKAVELDTYDTWLYYKGLIIYRGEYEYGKNQNLGLSMMEKSYESGNNRSDISYNLGQVYFNRDREKSKKYFLESDKKGNRNASFMLLVSFGDSEPNRIKKVEKYLDSLLVVDPNNIRNLNRKAVLLSDVKGDYKSSYDYFVRSCDNGHAYNCNFLGDILADKNDVAYYGQKRNKKKAKEYKDKACKLNVQYCKK